MSRPRGRAGRAGNTLKRVFDRQPEPVRFLIVGGWNTLFSYLLFATILWATGPVFAPLSGADSPALNWIGLHSYVVVQWFAWALSVPQSTIALKLLVFRGTGRWFHEIARSYLVYLPLQFFSTGSLWLLVNRWGLHPLAGQLITVCLAATLSYLGNKFFTFRKPRGE